MSFLRQLGWELFRMFARRRTYIGFGVFVLVEMLMLFLFTRTGVRQGISRWIEEVAGGLDTYFSGLTLAFLIIAFTIFLLAAPFLSLVAGDIVAKETEDGNLRLLLSRPVSRFRLLAIKYVACQIYALALFAFVGITALLVGIYERGAGGGFVVWSPEMPRVTIFDWNEGLARYFGSLPGFVLAFLPVTSFAFALSCLRIKPAAATIVTLAWLLADFILEKIPFFEDYRHWFMTPRMNNWLYLYYQEIPWPAVTETAAQLVGIGLTAFVIGWVAFEQRDIKT
ncbi:MAG: ABC transporter permease [Verrucomicrobiae bacterium]|nr:ABC transporter permease [Verrucomicrobiae bacterium]MCP5540308.1 ABC transporter permease [Akkermansiaceae bacterium]MCP5550684.1 ABC transporter permease [Akkermansiaceae bacterium]